LAWHYLFVTTKNIHMYCSGSGFPGEQFRLLGAYSCNNVAPVTNLCLGRATTRSHSSQWSKTVFSGQKQQSWTFQGQ
jgi:hypothetical protein